jgi:uncharacterized protein YjbI with pentapeptide repeats
LFVNVRDRLTGELVATPSTLGRYFEDEVAMGHAIRRVSVSPLQSEQAAGVVVRDLVVEDSVMPGIRVTNCTIAGRFQEVVLELAAFVESTLRETQFVSCNLRGSSLVGVDAQDVVFDGCSFLGAALAGDFRGAKCVNCNLTGADLSAARFGPNTEFDGSILRRAVLPTNRLAVVRGNLNSHNFSGTLLYEVALDQNNVERQAYALLIKERTDLCDELWSPTGIFPPDFYSWAMSTLGYHLLNNKDAISADFLESICAVLDIPELHALLEQLRSEEG